MIFAVVMPLAAMADSYTSLWKKYDAARAKDHPKTVLEVLGKISEKAKSERAYGQLLKAQVLSANIPLMRPRTHKMNMEKQN